MRKKLDCQTLTREDLATTVYQALGASRSDSAALVEHFLEEIGDAIARGENVKISGFGNFMVLNKGERVGRNPKTRAEYPISPRRVVSFRPSKILKAIVNSETEA